MLAPPDPPAELVQLREAEPLGVLHEHHGRVRHVDADLDHGGGDQHVVTARLRNASMRASLSAGRMRPCSRSTVRSGKTSVARRSASASAARTCVRLPSSIAAHTTNACRPAATSRAHHLVRRAALGRPCARPASAIGRRPAGSSSRTDDVEVAVVRERERPRDRRGGHDQHVRVAALALQRHPLVQAEPMLLVDDGEREVGEAHRLLHQRVRADHEVHRPVGDALEDPRAGPCPSRAPVSSA